MFQMRSAGADQQNCRLIEKGQSMTRIDAVTITAQYTSFSWPVRPTLVTLWTCPGNLRIGRWQAGILSLDLPDGDRSRISCPNVDEARRAATLVWNTPAGHAAVARRMTEEQRLYEAEAAAATWTGERRHEWQEPKQLVTLVRVAIQQAVEAGILPIPNDYRVTWRSSDQTIRVVTRHMLTVNDSVVNAEVWPLLKPFNASKARNSRGQVFEQHAFNIEIEAPNDRMIGHRVAAMERAGFPAEDIGYVQDIHALFARGRDI
jgi:hypothetical protein